ncbi:hypothetical protein FA15DRAFT_663325 [Coprinopsis marcescibilis]|uniref:Uncharacterized protein n=1 Tax=Coprinopsis marcescibilis TaxID=230819 RepID=A0A5C3LC33_COPMA|nr:hypothetical protein FA15DRAFT_663325 [Coprinopsis marcescibilis]
MASFQYQKSVDNIPTTFIIQSFADRVLVLVTQLGKVGNKIQATLLSTAPLFSPEYEPKEHDPLWIPPPPPAIQLTPLLGSSTSEHQQTLHSLYASQIATVVWYANSQFALDGDRKSVVVGIALKRVDVEGSGCELSDGERGTFREIIMTIQKIIRETVAN